MMDEVAGQRIEMNDAEPLVFGARLMRPWVPLATEQHSSEATASAQ